jgi:hypothetical protein
MNFQMQKVIAAMNATFVAAVEAHNLPKSALDPARQDEDEDGNPIDGRIIMDYPCWRGDSDRLSHGAEAEAIANQFGYYTESQDSCVGDHIDGPVAGYVFVRSILGAPFIG